MELSTRPYGSWSDHHYIKDGNGNKKSEMVHFAYIGEEDEHFGVELPTHDRFGNPIPVTAAKYGLFSKYRDDLIGYSLMLLQAAGMPIVVNDIDEAETVFPSGLRLVREVEEDEGD